MIEHLPTFLALAAVVIATPGPDTALTIRNTLAGGRRAGVATAFGDLRDDAGLEVTAGMYLVRLETGSGWLTRSVLRLR
jgi:threonine/homoserine/homoserine lactone efflux protein